MPIKLARRRDSIRLFVFNNQQHRHSFQEFVHVGKKKVDLVIIMGVKGGPAYPRQLDSGSLHLQADGERLAGTVETGHTGPGTVENGKWSKQKVEATLVFKKQ